jgi:hypothetical protein
MRMETPKLNLNWAELTPEQKRQQRIDRYLNPIGINFVNDEARKQYQIRAQRYVDVYNLQEPDRVPVELHFGSLPLQNSGIDYYTAMYDFKRAVQVYDQFNAKYASDLENYASAAMIVPGEAFELLDYKLYSWPGHGLPRKSTGYQFQEGEYMKASEYDDLVLNPADFWMRYYIPRTFGSLSHLGRLDPITDIIEIPTMQLMALATPELQAILQNLLDVGKKLQERKVLLQSIGMRGMESGFPRSVHYLGLAPFDIIGDTLRGTQGIMKDMYRCPEKLLEALDVIAKIQIKTTIARANATKGLVVTFPLHKGADGWMSQKQFETFYWPSLKKSMNAFIDEGLIVSLFAEGSYNTRLGSVNEFPKGSVHWWFDKTDMAQAKKILGGKCSIAGNVPGSLLLTGTPDQVKKYCRDLIEVCGPGGGYILSDGAADAESKVENLLAMVQAAREYGVYHK